MRYLVVQTGSLRVTPGPYAWAGKFEPRRARSIRPKSPRLRAHPGELSRAWQLDPDDPADVLAFERQIGCEVAAVQEKLDVIMVQRPVDLAVGEQEVLGIGCSRECQPQRLADDAVGAVGTDQVGGMDFEAGAVFVPGLHHDDFCSD